MSAGANGRRLSGPPAAPASPPARRPAPWSALRDDGVLRPLLGLAIAILRLVLPRRFGFRVSGLEHLPPAGPVLLVLNHVADVDPPFVALAVAPRPARFLTASRHFGRQPMRWLLTGLGAIPLRVDRPDLATLRGARERLLRGGLVVVWPEGAPSYRDRLAPFREGVGHLALTPGVTVLPAALWGMQRVMVRGLPIGRGPTRMAIGPPVPVPDSGTRRERATQVTADCRARVADLLAGLVREIG